MAASLLRIGRLGSLKCLQQGSWVTLRTPFTAALCTKAEEPKKPAKKAKAASKTLDAPEERASLLAYKTAVAFPTRLSSPGFLNHDVAICANPETSEAAGATGTTPVSKVTKEVSGAETGSVTISEKDSVATDFSKDKLDSTSQMEASLSEGDATSKINAENSSSSTAADTTKPSDQESSSSSSDSDSDSDSDDDDEVAKKNFTIEKAESKAAVSPEKIKTEDIVGSAEASSKSTEKAKDKLISPELNVSKTVADGLAADAVATSKSNAESGLGKKAGTEEINDPAPTLVKSVTEEIASEKQPEDKLLTKVTQDQATAHGITENNGNVSHTTPKVDAKCPDLESPSKPVVDHAVEEETKVEGEAGTEVLVDSAPGIIETAEPVAEPAVAEPEEAAPAPEPEPFDNTSYKNLQHHNYHVYTFVDMDVEMAKHRLPQPSTGRDSPRQ